MPVSEKTHWYAKDGSPAYTTIGKNGIERNTTLRDARKLCLAPSVTSILSIAAKPALENWKIDQALMSALTLPKIEGEPLDEFMRRAKEDSKQHSIDAAKRGTEIHADIESGFKEANNTLAFTSVDTHLNKLFGKRNWIAEQSFCCDLGYGGKLDLYCDDIVVDFKTKDGLEGKDPAKLVYDEHGMQLSAYANGVNIDAPKRVSVFIDRGDPSVVLSYIWDMESHIRHFGMFCHLLNYWKALKKYRAEDGVE